MHQAQWSPERPLPPPVSLASQSHHVPLHLVDSLARPHLVISCQHFEAVVPLTLSIWWSTEKLSAILTASPLRILVFCPHASWVISVVLGLVSTFIRKAVGEPFHSR